MQFVIMGVGRLGIFGLFQHDRPNGGLLKYGMCNSGIGENARKYGSQTESFHDSDTSSVATTSSGTID